MSRLSKSKATGESDTRVLFRELLKVKLALRRRGDAVAAAQALEAAVAGAEARKAGLQFGTFTKASCSC
jgi:hypothetical protein